jgi:hypothetical protein
MSMILLEPANTIRYNSLEDQAADHLINEVLTCPDEPELPPFEVVCAAVKTYNWCQMMAWVEMHLDAGTGLIIRGDINVWSSSA